MLSGVEGVDESRKAVQETLQNFIKSDKAKSWKEELSAIIDFFISSEAERKFYGKDVVENKIIEGSITDELIKRTYISPTVLNDVVYRTFRRSLYCSSFNDMDKSINENKFAGLIAYWVMKLHPVVVFSIQNYQQGKADTDWMDKEYKVINEKVAAFVIISMIRHKMDTSGASISVSAEKKFFEKLVHAFRYRDISENSLMLLAESIGKEGFDLAD